MNLEKQLISQAEEWEQAAATLRAAVAALSKLGKKPSSNLVSSIETAGSPSGGFSQLVTNPESGFAAVKEILAQSGAQPLSKKEIVEKLAQVGANLSENTLTTYLSRYDDFQSIGRDQWVLADNRKAALEEQHRQLAKKLLS